MLEAKALVAEKQARHDAKVAVKPEQVVDEHDVKKKVQAVHPAASKVRFVCSVA